MGGQPAGEQGGLFGQKKGFHSDFIDTKLCA